MTEKLTSLFDFVSRAASMFDEGHLGRCFNSRAGESIAPGPVATFGFNLTRG